MTGLLKIQGRLSEIAPGMQVRRVLPAVSKRAVGPFVFFDHMGPIALGPGVNGDVDGHPHIGLATLTYLFEGSLLHRDSIGSQQVIAPGAVNWMVAGSGVVHSERNPGEEAGNSRRIHGLQLWVALPPEKEEMPPSFQHVGAGDVPIVRLPGAELRVLVGEAFGLVSPVATLTPTLYLDVQLSPDTTWSLPALAPEMALYCPEHSLEVNGQEVEPCAMVVLTEGATTAVSTRSEGARFVVIGGAPLERPVHMWWNYVSTSKDRIAAAAKRWNQGGFAPIPGESTRVEGPKWIDREA